MIFSKVDNLNESVVQLKAPEEIAVLQVNSPFLSHLFYFFYLFIFYLNFHIRQSKFLLLVEMRLQRILPVWFPTSFLKNLVW